MELVTSWVLAAALAGGSIPSVGWEYARERGAEACPDGDDLRRQVIERLGTDPFSASAERRLRVSLAREGPTAWRATVTVTSGEGRAVGERVLRSQGSDCGTLSEALVLAVTLVLDPFGEASAAAAEPEPPKAPEPPPSPAPAPVPTPVPTPTPAAKSLALAAWLAARADLGVGPSLAPGGALGVGVRWSEALFGLEAYGGAGLATSSEAGAVSVSALGAAALGCWDRARWGVCAQLKGTRLSLGGPGAEASAPLAQWSGGPRAFARFGLAERWAARVDGALHVPFSRAALWLGSQRLWTSPPVAGGLSLAVEWSP